MHLELSVTASPPDEVDALPAYFERSLLNRAGDPPALPGRQQ